jgi:dCMP deaminase
LEQEEYIKKLKLAERISRKSSDPSTKVGCVITNTDNRLISVGYNRMPCNCSNDVSLWNDRQIKYQRVLHAEVVAILNAKEDIRGYNLYIWPTASFMPICSRCASVICEKRIGRIIWSYDPLETKFNHWKDKCEESVKMFNEAGIEIIGVENINLRSV